MTHASEGDIPAGQGQTQPESAMNAEDGVERVRMQALTAEPLIPLNVELHHRLSRSGGAKASTLSSAMASLERVRKTLAGQ